MAESILFDMSKGILLKLGSLAVQEIALWWGVEDELEKLKNTVTRIQAVLLDAEEQQTHSCQVKDWLGKLKEVVYNVDDLLDDFSTEALRRQAMDEDNNNKLKKEVRLFFSRSNRFVYGLKMAHEIKAVRERLVEIADDRKFELEVRPPDEKFLTGRVREQTDSSPPEAVIGRDNDKQKIIELLLASNYDENVSIISIVGIGGLGKTALAQDIFNDEKVKTVFDLKYWVCVSDDFDVKKVVQKLLGGEATEDQSADVSQLKDRFQKIIEWKKYLLVLDDVWNEDWEKWLNLKKVLIRGGTGSKIIVTTRSEKVANITGAPYELEGLSKDESWSLFKRMAFDQGSSVLGLEDIGREIVEKCKGVPLAIRTVGSMLYFKKTRAEWLSFKEHELSKVANQEENNILATLLLSYYHLPSHLKQCFTYCKLFPKDHEFNVESLIQVWIGQGFVRSSDANQCLENVGYEYFTDLFWRSFFQDAQRDVLGNIKTCKMHDLMHDLATLVGGTESEKINPNIRDVGEKVRHMSLDFDWNVSWKIPIGLLKAKQLRTFLLPSQTSSSGKGEKREVPNYEAILTSFRRLRVVDLHDLGIEEVSTSVKKLKHARYLDLSKNGVIKVLPGFVTKLPNLQVLKLNDCKELKELPTDIRKMVNLRHLDCEGCSNLTHMPCGLGQLTALQTLTWFVVAKDTAVSEHVGGLSELNRLNDLRRLEIRNLGYAKNGGLSEFEDANLIEKQHLQSLTLRWNYDSYASIDAAFDEMSLQRLQPNANLEQLRVYDYGGAKFPRWLSSLSNLVEIWIVSCKGCRFLPPLDQIHSLKELWLSDLTDLEYVDGRGVSYFIGGGGGGSTFFPSLKKVWLWHCPSLTGWWKMRDGYDEDEIFATTLAERPQFPCLSFLEIKGCPRLSSMPLFPTVESKLYLERADFKPFQQTTKMKMKMEIAATQHGSLKSPCLVSSLSHLVQLWIVNCNRCQYLPTLDQLPFLTDLWISELSDLEYVYGEESYWLSRGDQERTTFFPSMKKLWIWKCPQLKGWWKNSNVEDNVDGDVTARAIAELPQFPSLSLLEIKHCPELTSMPLFPALGGKLSFENTDLEPFLHTMKMEMMAVHDGLLQFPLANIVEIWIVNCKGCQHLPSLDQLPFLTDLWLSDLSDLEYVDSEKDGDSLSKGMEAPTFFPSLKKLWIWKCPKLKGWWKWRRDDEDCNAQLPQFPCLSLLEIKNCPEMTWLPLFPTVGEKFYFENTNLEPFLQTMKMKMVTTQLASVSFLDRLSVFRNVVELWIVSCKTSPHFPSLDHLPCLKDLWLSNLTDLEYIDGESDDFFNGGGGPTFFPSLKKLWIWHCPNVKGWWKKIDDAGDSDTTTTTSELPEFPCLSLLDIRNCPMLSWVPLFPTLDTKLFIVNASLKPLHQTLEMNRVPPQYGGLRNQISCLSNLKDLWISDVANLEFMDCELFPLLKQLWIYNCPILKGWRKKKDETDGTLTAKTADQLPQFLCLSLLEIKHCPQLTSMPLFPSLVAELRLQNASVEPLQQTMKMKPTAHFSSLSSSLVLPLSKLKKFSIVSIADLESLPKKGLQNLTSLEELYIEDCPKLSCLPRELRSLTSLRVLSICSCPLLVGRCGNKKGADWPKIAHIADVEIDSQKIQQEGKYLLDD